jgi:hypothetical protein
LLTCSITDFVPFAPLEAQAHHLVAIMVSSGVCFGRMYREAAMKAFLATHESDEEKFFNAIIAALRLRSKFISALPFYLCSALFSFFTTFVPSNLPSIANAPFPERLSSLNLIRHPSSIVHRPSSIIHRPSSILHHIHPRWLHTRYLESAG